jgi:hypothetical protein
MPTFLRAHAIGGSRLRAATVLGLALMSGNCTCGEREEQGKPSQPSETRKGSALVRDAKDGGRTFNLRTPDRRVFGLEGGTE